MADLEEMVNNVVSVITNDGRRLVGTLRGFDQFTNLVLEDCHERVYSLEQPVQVVPLGLYVLRGDNVAIVGELEMKIDVLHDLGQIRCLPLDPIIH